MGKRLGTQRLWNYICFFESALVILFLFFSLFSCREPSAQNLSDASGWVLMGKCFIIIALPIVVVEDTALVCKCITLHFHLSSAMVLVVVIGKEFPRLAGFHETQHCWCWLLPFPGGSLQWNFQECLKMLCESITLKSWVDGLTRWS